MDTKEIKTALKNARECIREKQFKEALKHCKTVLAQDKNNYNALVFVGVAADGMEQFDQAEKAYKRATEAAPDQVLAWQGLCGFYEKHGGHEQDLVNVYQKLQEVYKGDEEKKNDILSKLADLDVKIGATSMAIPIYENLVKEEKNENKKEKYMYKLEEILRNEKSLSEEWKNLYLSTCDNLFELDPVQFTDTMSVVKFYVRCLLQMQCVGSKLEFKCKTLQLKFPNISYPTEILVIMTMDKHIGEKFPVLHPSMDDYISTISKLTPDSSYLLAGQGYVQLCNKKFIEARDCLSRAIDQLPKIPCIQYYHGLTLKHLHDFSGAEKLCKMCFKTLERKDRVLTIPGSITSTVMILQADMLYGIGTETSLQSALEIIQQMSDEVSTDLLKGQIYLKLNDLDNCEKCIHGDSPEMIALSGCLLYYKNNYEEAVVKLKTSIETDPNNSWSMFWYAKALWEKYKYSKEKTDIETCYMSLLKSAKLDPYNSETFLYLGHFSLTIQHDESRARKCYQKAFDLDTRCNEAGAALCDLLNSADQEEEAYKLLLSVTSKASAGCGKWAWLRLGLYQVKHDSANSAVTSFQAALRGDPKDNHVWECLAEAYYHRGSYTAALKAFTKASELDQDSIYCLYHIAAIKQTLGMFTEAIDEYKLILSRDPEYVPALKGIGETYILLANHHLELFFNGKARDNCQEALNYLTRAATHRPDLSCLWKFMGDACTIIHHMAKETFRMEVPKKLLEKSDQESTVLSMIQTLELGARCYGRALKILPECASLWHDLGFNLFHQSQNCPSEAMTTVAGKSINSLKKALSLDSSNHLHWNALGVVASSKGAYNPTLAQHCFIQSIKAEASNHIAWTNLATLYLTNDNIHLAHEAFKMAQRLEPTYVAAWIGQALIAETVGDEDAMDLFRHTTELATHVEGASGYGSWVCSMLQDESKHNTDLYQYSIKQMAAVPAASTGLGKYLDRIKTNATAYNMYGLLLEQQGLFRSAVQAFKSAIDLGSCKEPAKIRMNLARVLCQLQLYDEAMSQYDKVDMPTTFNDLCSLGYACYKSGKYKESYQAYQEASELATGDMEKSHVLTALGMVAYKFGDVDGAKAVLLQSSQLTPASMNGLKSLCALGITLSDSTLTMAVLQELFSHGDTEVDVSHLMTISQCLLENNLKGAKIYIQQCIHKNPNQSSLWKLLSRLLLRHFPESSGSVAASCAECAYRLNPLMHNIQNMVTANLLRSTTTNNSKLMKSAVKALHINPDIQENWKNLVKSLDRQCENENVKCWTDISDSYNQWLSKTEE